ncbi:hypothetical protein AAF712_012601 [Marasmius tenuissimus]|uniref:Uncharacterized protein n=1 Tax=Marasmius tenuissimus TaxID=585030 RepID=A0ABR2ZH11_9AGAR
MTDIPYKVQCPVCLESFRLPTKKEDNYAILPCQANCPTCRQTFKRDAAHHLYLSFERSVIASTITTVEGLGEMDAKSKLISVRTAGERVKRASEELKCQDTEVATSLIQAVEEFKDRIVPVFEKQQHDAEELSRLREELRVANRQVARSKLVTSQLTQKDEEIQALQKDLREANQARLEAINMSRGTGERIRRLEEQNESLSSTGIESNAEISRLKGILEEHGKTSRSYKAKIRGLKEENHRLEAQLSLAQESEHVTLDESLILESSRQTLQETQIGLTTPSPSPPSPNNVLSHSPPFNKENVHSTSNSSFVYEGLPPLGFKSDWTVDGGATSTATNPLKRKVSGNAGRSTSGITLDRKGRPVGSVQLGPKRSRKAP